MAGMVTERVSPVADLAEAHVSAITDDDVVEHLDGSKVPAATS
jgi:hypothetical protein